MMRPAKIRFILTSAGAFMLVFLASCAHKELCFDRPTGPEVCIVADYEREWQYTYTGGPDWAHYPGWRQDFGISYDSMLPGIPTGLRVQVYNSDGSNNILNIAPEGETVQMFPGEHAILFYNNDTQSIVFDDMQSYASARATTRTRTRSSYGGNPYMEGYDENTVGAPDMLYGNYIESYTVEQGDEPGMASAVWLNSGRTSDEAATILYDCTVEDFGMQAFVRSFGIPGFPNEHYTTKSPNSYSLNLEVRLKNGIIKSFDFDVTDQVAAQPQGGVIIVDGIEISDEEGESGGSGFDVDVDDWGEYEDIELPL